MAIISLPLSFTNSFWSQDYRRGLEVLYHQLEQGTHENDQITSFIRSRANAESQLASSLSLPAITGATGFGRDDGASLLMAFRGLQAESANQAQAHATVAKELHSLVADPFDQWATQYKGRLAHSKNTVIGGHLAAYEQAHDNIVKLKHDYHEKVRKADEALDDARFAPNTASIDNYTTSPRMRPVDSPHKPRTPPQRSTSVSERIANRLREIQKRSAGAIANATHPDDTTETVFNAPTSPDSVTSPIISVEKADKGKGKAIDTSVQVAASPLDLSPVETARSPPSPAPIPLSPILLGPQVSFPPQAISDLLQHASTELKLRPVRFPLIGEYPNCFTGDEFVEWLLSNVVAFQGDWEQADDACRTLTEKEGLLRRVGELGNAWEPSDEAWYQFRPKAFELGRKPSHDTETVNGTATHEPLLKAPITSFTSLVTKALAQANSSEPAHVKLASDAVAADAAYKIAARRLDRQRLGLEEQIEECLKVLQRWESERLGAVKSCLLQFQGTLSNLPSALSPSLDRSSTLISAFQPQNDLVALIERYRTGPFRPQPILYKSIAHDERDVLFGGDLRKWSEAMSGAWSAQVHSIGAGIDPKKDIIPIPLVLERLLEGLDEVYKKTKDDSEKRKAWIYEVPLPASHHLRERLNASVVPHDPSAPEAESTPQSDIPLSLITGYDAPVIASTIRLWLLELDPPIALWEGWEEFRKIYPSVGSAFDEEKKQARIDNICSALLKLPKIHLQVLDRVAGYLVKLIESTTTPEGNDVYINKLALSLGRVIIRPRVETELSVQDRFPTMLVIDLLQSYSQILPPTIIKKKRESERKTPIRKRTVMVDMRVSRSKFSLDAGEDEKKRLLHAQHVKQNPSLVVNKRASAESSPVPPVPALPQSVKEAAMEMASPPPTPEKKKTFQSPPTKHVTVAAVDPDMPPEFKDPPPEPADDGSAPPMPDFKDPPPEPPSPTSPSSPRQGVEGSHNNVDDDSPAVPANVLRNSSGSGVKGPRMVGRGPRPNNGPASPRPSSVLARGNAFERRTMESDAEDNVLNGS